MYVPIAVSAGVSADTAGYSGFELEKAAEIAGYLYGRHFFLKAERVESTRQGVALDLYFLVERHYVEAIIPRLASGLYWARKVSLEDSGIEEEVG